MAAENVRPACIKVVRVSIGPLTGTEPTLVRYAFDALKAGMGLKHCELEIDEQKLIALCRQCNMSFEILNFVFRCPYCDCGSVQITQGDQFLLTSIEVDDGLDHAFPPNAKRWGRGQTLSTEAKS